MNAEKASVNAEKEFRIIYDAGERTLPGDPPPEFVAAFEDFIRREDAKRNDPLEQLRRAQRARYQQHLGEEADIQRRKEDIQRRLAEDQQRAEREELERRNFEERKRDALLNKLRQDLECVRSSRDIIKFEMCLANFRSLIEESHRQFSTDLDDQMIALFIELVDVANNNVNLMIEAGRTAPIKRIFDRINALLGTNIDFEVHMDTNSDEEVARRLQEEWSMEP